MEDVDAAQDRVGTRIPFTRDWPIFFDLVAYYATAWAQ